MKILSLFYVFSCVSTIFGVYTDPRQLLSGRQSFVKKMGFPLDSNILENDMDDKLLRLIKRDAELLPNKISEKNNFNVSNEESKLNNIPENQNNKTHNLEITTEKQKIIKLKNDTEALSLNISVDLKEKNQEMVDLPANIEESKNRNEIANNISILQNKTSKCENSIGEVKKFQMSFPTNEIRENNTLYKYIHDLMSLNQSNSDINNIYTFISKFIKNANTTDTNILNIKTIGQLLSEGNPVTISSLVVVCIILFIMGMLSVNAKNPCKKKKNSYLPVELNEFRIDRKPIIKNSIE